MALMEVAWVKYDLPSKFLSIKEYAMINSGTADRMWVIPRKLLEVVGWAWSPMEGDWENSLLLKHADF